MTKKGNKNAKKHGIFSKFIAVVEDHELIDDMALDKNYAELTYARSRLANAQEEYNKETDPDRKIKLDFACRHWAEIIGNYIRANTDQRDSEKAIFETLMDAVRAANDSQNVVK